MRVLGKQPCPGETPSCVLSPAKPAGFRVRRLKYWIDLQLMGCCLLIVITNVLGICPIILTAGKTESPNPVYKRTQMIHI